MAKKKLKIWNGRGYSCRINSDPRWDTANDGHAFVCAYSVADALRVIAEYTGHLSASLSEIKNYWSAGCWGTPMEGITPERGLWVVFRRNEKPVRLV
jgi:hypothetical protein